MATGESQMTMKSNHGFFSADLPEAELEQILQRVDENLEFRSMLREHGPASSSPGEGSRTGPVREEMNPHRQRVRALRSMQAPLFVLGGFFLSRIAWLCNLPIRVIGRKQIRFNAELLDAIEAMATDLDYLHRWIAQVSADQKAMQKSP